MPTIEEILDFLAKPEKNSYNSAQDQPRSEKDRNWFHGYADACHELEMFIRQIGAFAPMVGVKKK